MIQPVRPMYNQPMSGVRPVYNAVNIEIHAPQMNEAPHDYPQSEGQYACPHCHVYDIPRTSIYDAPKPENMVIPQQTIVKHITKNIYATNPIKQENKQPKAVPETKTENNVEGRLENKVENKVTDPIKAESVVQPKKIEIVKPQDVKPVLDINTFIAELASPDFARQADAMGTLAQVSKAAPNIAAQVLDVRVIDTLIGIMNRNTDNLAIPTQRQMQIREAMMKGQQVSAQDRADAEVQAPVELAEKNKEYAIFTLASLQKVYNGEVKKMGGQTVPLKDLPGGSELIEQATSNPNPMVRIAGLSALNYLQCPEYKADLAAIYQKASTDENPMVQAVAAKAIELLK